MSQTVKHPDAVEHYLLRLRRALGSVKAESVDEILSDIRSHIEERVAASPVPAGQAVMEVLERLGTPQQLAANYRAEGLLERASVSSGPLLLLRATFYWALTGLGGFVALLILLFGYLFGISFLVTAVLKPFYGDRVGLWVGPDTLQLGAHMGSEPLPAGRELLGYWIIPLGLVIGLLSLILTTLFVRWLIRRQRTRWQAMPALD